MANNKKEIKRYTVDYAEYLALLSPEERKLEGILHLAGCTPAVHATRALNKLLSKFYKGEDVTVTEIINTLDKEKQIVDNTIENWR